jgi:capsid protein
MWAGSKKSDRAEINTFYQNQKLYHFFQQRDNDMFTRLFYSDRRDLINPLQIKFFDPNQIRGYASTNSYAQYNYDDGITRDASGRETGYKIWYYSPEGKYIEKTIPARGARSKRIMMIHGFNPEYAGQGRGYTRLAHALQEFENLTDFKVSHILKAIQQTIFSVFVKPGPDNPATNILDDKVSGPLAETAAAEGLEVDESGNIADYTTMPEATMDTPGSVGVFNLNKGEDFKPFEQSAPVDNYDTFVGSFFSHISASLGMPVEVALMKFEQNYSSSRGALVLFWRIAQIWRNEMKADFLDPIYESWLSEEIAGGRIQAPGWSDPLMRAAWLSAWWAGAPMPNIDPMKTAKSDQLYTELGAQTIDDVAENFNGSSGKANLAKNARQFEDVPGSPWQNSSSPGPSAAPTGAASALIRKIAEAVADEIDMRSD